MGLLSWSRVTELFETLNMVPHIFQKLLDRSKQREQRYFVDSRDRTWDPLTHCTIRSERVTWTKVKNNYQFPNVWTVTNTIQAPDIYYTNTYIFQDIWYCIMYLLTWNGYASNPIGTKNWFTTFSSLGNNPKFGRFGFGLTGVMLLKHTSSSVRVIPLSWNSDELDYWKSLMLSPKSWSEFTEMSKTWNWPLMLFLGLIVSSISWSGYHYTVTALTVNSWKKWQDL